MNSEKIWHADDGNGYSRYIKSHYYFCQIYTANCQYQRKARGKSGGKKAAYLNHKQASHYKCSSLCSINPFIRC